MRSWGCCSITSVNFIELELELELDTLDCEFEFEFEFDEEAKPMRLALITSTGERCGIAAYSRALVEALGDRVALEVLPVEALPGDRAALERANAAELIHLQHEYSFWGSALPGRSRFPGLLAALQRPLVMTAHTVAPAEEILDVAGSGGGWRGAVKRLGVGLAAVRRFVEVEPFRSALRLIVHSERARDSLVGRGFSPERVSCLPMPCPRPVEPADAGAALRELGLDGRGYILGFGFITPAKGFDLALAAFAGLDYPGRLVLAGAARDAEGEACRRALQEQALQLGIAGRVLFPGYVDDATLTALLRGTDLALLPYRSGTGSYALSLAMACGAPTLTTDLPCFAGAPVLRARADTGALRRKMAAYLAQPGRRAELATGAREWADQRSWEAAAHEHLRLYGEALGDRGEPRTG
jgi:glycosyltransferase involved in cell wall biosynthesis